MLHCLQSVLIPLALLLCKSVRTICFIDGFRPDNRSADEAAVDETTRAGAAESGAEDGIVVEEKALIGKIVPPSAFDSCFCSRLC